MTDTSLPRRPVRWHIAFFLAPAVIIYSMIMILPLFETLRLSFFRIESNQEVFVGLGNFATLFGDDRWAAHKLAEQMYKEQQAGAQAQGQPGADAKAGEARKEDDGNVVDAEYEEVKDKKG